MNRLDEATEGQLHRLLALADSLDDDDIGFLVAWLEGTVQGYSTMESLISSAENVAAYRRRQEKS
jgi:hypothetical protein